MVNPKYMNFTQYISVNNTLENLENEVSTENYNTIYAFINNVAAEGAGDSQQERQIYALKTVLKKFSHKDFTLEGPQNKSLKYRRRIQQKRLRRVHKIQDPWYPEEVLQNPER